MTVRDTTADDLHRHCGPSATLRASIADEMERLRDDIEALGAALCADPRVVDAHAEALQALDRIGQHQVALASVLRADDAGRCIAGLPLEQLRQRLS